MVHAHLAGVEYKPVDYLGQFSGLKAGDLHIGSPGWRRQASSDTEICAIRRHLRLRTSVVPSSCSGSLPQADGLLEVPESAATALNVEHMAIVQEPVEDGDREAAEWFEACGVVELPTEGSR